MKNGNKMHQLFFHDSRLLKVALSLVFFLFTASIMKFHVTEFDASAFYYVSNLPLEYWIGVGLLLILIPYLCFIYDGANRNRYCILSIILLALFLFGLNTVSYDNPRFQDVYGVIKNINYMEGMGHFGYSYFGTGYSSYLNEFPGALIAFLSLSLITELDLISIARFYPIVLIFLLIIIVFAISSKYSKKNAFFVTALLIPLSWVQEYHLAPQSLGLLLYCVFFMSVVTSWFSNKTDYRQSIIQILLIIAIVISHAGTPMFLIAALVSIESFYIASKYLHINSRDRSNKKMLILISSVIFVGWLAYVGNGQLAEIIKILSYSIDNIFSEKSVITYTFSNPEYSQIFINNTRQLLAIIELTIAIIGSYLIFRKNKNVTTLTVSWLLSTIIFYLVSLFYKGAFFGRFFIFFTIPLICIIAYVLFSECRSNFNKFEIFSNGLFSSLIVILFVIAALFFPLNYYGGDYFEFRPDTSLSGENFAKNHEFEIIDKTQSGFVETADPSKLMNDQVVYDIIWYNYYEVKNSCGDAYNSAFTNYNVTIIYTSQEYKLAINGNQNEK